MKQRLIAHRGYAVNAPPNSLAAFRAAGERGYWAIETDIRKTADGILVCCHDATIDSMYDGSGTIAAMRWEVLSRIPLRQDGSRMPLFREYLQICREYDAVPFIELKTGDVEQVLREALAVFPAGRIVVSGTDLERLRQVRARDSSVFLHHIFSAPELLPQLCTLKPCGVSYNYPDACLCPQNLLAQTHALGIHVCLRAGDSTRSVRDMVAMGLDYIPTNCFTPQSFDTLFCP